MNTKGTGMRTPLLSAGLIFAILAALMSPPARAQTTYYKCSQGNAFGCVATSEDGKHGCENRMGQCGKWIEVKTSFSIAPNAFAYENSPLGARANHFIDEVSRQIYGQGLPRYKDDTLFTTSELYEDPAEHGWRVLDEDESYLNAIALWPGVAGVVVVDSPQLRGEARIRKVDVLYPSHRINGHLRILSAWSIDKKNAPKFIVPAKIHPETDPLL